MSPVSPPDQPLIAARGISLGRSGRTILDDVELEVRPREIVALVGPNGAGKTTLLRVLLGTLSAERGQVSRRPGLTLGYVPQRLALDPILPLDVRRFLTIGRRFDAAAAERALEATGVRHLLRASMHTLSGGEFQRVMLAYALIRGPDLLILDEPAQGIDFRGQLDLYGLIARIRDETGCGILLVSHDLHLVMAGTDRVICLNGHVCCSGRPEAVSRDPAYVALFGSRGVESLAIYHHEHDHAHGLGGEVVQPDQRTGRALSRAR